MFRDIEAARTNEPFCDTKFIGIGFCYVDAVIKPYALRYEDKKSIGIEGYDFENDFPIELSNARGNNITPENKADDPIANPEWSSSHI
jgi:hypothetical protein